MIIKKPFSARERYTISFPEPTMAKQAFKAECDINNILSRYNKTGVLEHITDSKALYGDFIDVDDYHASLDKVIESEALFKALPSKLRNRFDNDPGEFLAFVGDPQNKDEMIELGLMKDPVVSEKILGTKTSKKEKKTLPEMDVAESQHS